VGVLKENLVVAYFNLCVVLFCCSWILPNIWGNARTIHQDEHGFWLVNFAHRLPPMEEPYVFPTFVSQVSCNHIPMSLNEFVLTSQLFNGLKTHEGWTFKV
jgi:hypothetical protein